MTDLVELSKRIDAGRLMQSREVKNCLFLCGEDVLTNDIRKEMKSVGNIVLVMHNGEAENMMTLFDGKHMCFSGANRLVYVADPEKVDFDDDGVVVIGS